MSDSVVLCSFVYVLLPLTSITLGLLARCRFKLGSKEGKVILASGIGLLTYGGVAWLLENSDSKMIQALELGVPTMTTMLVILWMVLRRRRTSTDLGDLQCLLHLMHPILHLVTPKPFWVVDSFLHLAVLLGGLHASALRRVWGTAAFQMYTGSFIVFTIINQWHFLFASHADWGTFVYKPLLLPLTALASYEGFVSSQLTFFLTVTNSYNPRLGTSKTTSIALASTAVILIVVMTVQSGHRFGLALQKMVSFPPPSSAFFFFFFDFRFPLADMV